jgi:YggT family protein
MFILGNLFEALAVILDKALWLYSLVVFIAVMISWVSPDPFNPVVQFLRSVTQPAFDWIRRRVPFAVIGMLDLSPMILLLVLWFARQFLVKSLFDLAFHLR